MTHSADRDDRDSTLAGVISILFLLGLLALVLIRFAGCANVTVDEYRYCKRIGYEAFRAKADSAYWLRHGLTP